MKARKWHDRRGQPLSISPSLNERLAQGQDGKAKTDSSFGTSCHDGILSANDNRLHDLVKRSQRMPENHPRGKVQ
jgi:hypothetical protein